MCLPRSYLKIMVPTHFPQYINIEKHQYPSHFFRLDQVTII